MNDIVETMDLEAIEQVRADVRLVMTEDGLTQADVARESGLAYGTFTPWLSGKYQGRSADVAARVARWLESRKTRTRTRAVLPTEPEFQETPTAAAIMETLAFAQAAPDFSVIVGGAGIGKTRTINEYQRRSSNVYVVTAEPCVSSPINLLVAIAAEMSVVEGASNKLSRAIAAKLRGAAALVVIDEAQHLTSAALDQLRTLHDKAGCGIAVSGNESIFVRLQGGTAQSAQFAQMHSRVGKRVVQPKARTRDACMLIAAWGIDPVSEEAALLKKIAAKPGALRIMTKVVRLASMLAAGAEAPLSTRFIKQAWDQLSAVALD